MTPKFTKAFYALDPISKVCFLNGMPIRQCQNEIITPAFKNEKIGNSVLSMVEQQKAFELFQNEIPTAPYVTIFCSKETDEGALDATGSLLKNYIDKDKNFNRFLYINKQDFPPREPEDVKDLYILMGAHQDDADICSWVRLWVRSRVGVPLWICLTADNPVAWYREKLGIKPHFLFSMRTAGRQNG